jgi:hypothetical protein
MEWRRVRVHLRSEDLKRMAFLGCVHTILENCGPEVTNT